MKPPRFTLRTLLVLTTLVAVFVWWYVQPKRGTITERQLAQITNGMTKNEVVSLLGKPLKQEDPLAPEWEYLIVSPSGEAPNSSLIVVFDKQDRVELATRMFHIAELGIMIDP